MQTGASYDANGDVLSDSLHSYAWDVETRHKTIVAGHSGRGASRLRTSVCDTYSKLCYPAD